MSKLLSTQSTGFCCQNYFPLLCSVNKVNKNFYYKIQSCVSFYQHNQQDLFNFIGFFYFYFLIKHQQNLVPLCSVTKVNKNFYYKIQSGLKFFQHNQQDFLVKIIFPFYVLSTKSTRFFIIKYNLVWASVNTINRNF